jgi:hypothetical protein
MAAIPQGAFAVVQVRKNFKRLSTTKYRDEDHDDKAKGDKNYGFNSKVLQEGTYIQLRYYVYIFFFSFFFYFEKPICFNSRIIKVIKIKSLRCTIKDAGMSNRTPKKLIFQKY